jgi:hypothetical protein
VIEKLARDAIADVERIPEYGDDGEARTAAIEKLKEIEQLAAGPRTIRPGDDDHPAQQIRRVVDVNVTQQPSEDFEAGFRAGLREGARPR